MDRFFIYWVVFASMAFQVPGQRAQLSRDLDRLVIRAGEYWKFAVAGERVKASNYVIPAKRESYLNTLSAPAANPKIVGFQFTDDPSRVVVRVSLKPIAGGVEIPAAVFDQTWSWTNNNWFLDPVDNSNPFQSRRATTAESAASIRELDRSFKLKTTDVDVGIVWEGAFPSFPIEIEYTGQEPIRIAADPRIPFVDIDPPSVQNIRPGTKTIHLRIDSRAIDGPFSVAARLTILYKDISIERVLNVRGSVFRPITFSQNPDIIVLAAGQTCEVKVRNNTDADVRIVELQSDDVFDPLTAAVDVKSKGEAAVVLSVRTATTVSNPQVRFFIAMPPNGVGQYTYTVKAKPSM